MALLGRLAAAGMHASRLPLAASGMHALAVEPVHRAPPRRPLAHCAVQRRCIASSALRAAADSPPPPATPPPPDGDKAAPAKFSRQWWLSKGVEMTIFAVTGSSTAYFIRPLLGVLEIHGSMLDGPWSYRFASIAIMTPSYSLLFLVVSALFGRAAWGRQFVTRMWSRPIKWVNKLNNRP